MSNSKKLSELLQELVYAICLGLVVMLAVGFLGWGVVGRLPAMLFRELWPAVDVEFVSSVIGLVVGLVGFVLTTIIIWFDSGGTEPNKKSGQPEDTENESS